MPCSVKMLFHDNRIGSKGIILVFDYQVGLHVCKLGEGSTNFMISAVVHQRTAGRGAKLSPSWTIDARRLRYAPEPILLCASVPIRGSCVPVAVCRLPCGRCARSRHLAAPTPRAGPRAAHVAHLLPYRSLPSSSLAAINPPASTATNH